MLLVRGTSEMRGPEGKAGVRRTVDVHNRQVRARVDHALAHHEPKTARAAGDGHDAVLEREGGQRRRPGRRGTGERLSHAPRAAPADAVHRRDRLLVDQMHCG